MSMIKRFLEDQRMKGNDLLNDSNTESDVLEDFAFAHSEMINEQEMENELRYRRIVVCISDDTATPCYDPNCPICKQVLEE